MTTQVLTSPVKPQTRDAIVWIDPDRAIVVCHHADGTEAKQVLERPPTESAIQFRARTVGQVADDPRVLMSGSAGDRTAFERTYVAITHRPDRLADVRPNVLA